MPLSWALSFLIAAIIAGFFGFSNIAFNLRLVDVTVADTFKILFILFVVLFLVALVSALLRDPKPRI